MVQIPDSGHDAWSRGLLWLSATMVAVTGAVLGWLYWAQPPYQRALANAVFTLALLPPCALAWLAWRRQRDPALQPATLALALGISCYLLASLLWDYYEHVLLQKPFPSWADAGYLLSTLCLIAAVLRQPTVALRPRLRTLLLLDSAVVVAAAATFSWYFILRPTYQAFGDDTLALALSVAYPALDLLLLAPLMWATLLRPDEAPLQRGQLLLAGSVLVAIASDTAFYLLNVWGVDLTLNPVNVGFVLSICLGAATCHAWLRPQPLPGGWRLGERGQQWLPYASVLACLLLLLALDGGERQVLWGSALVTVLVAARQLLSLMDVAALNRELAEATRAAEAATEAKSRFLANVSHELRTPLTLILAPLATLRGQLSAELRPLLARVERNALLLQNRVDEVLDYSKLEAGCYQLRPELLDIRELLATLTDAARDLASNKQCQLECQLERGLDYVVADRRALEKILLNLLSNAFKFTPAGGSVVVEGGAQGQNSFCLTVHDSGPGIAAEDQQRLFQRFAQLDDGATRMHGGSGIGLALVKELAEQMGGSVALSSEPGRGASFSVRLPGRVQSGLSTCPSPPQGQAVDEVKRRHFQVLHFAELPRAAATTRLLVVDDNPDMRAYLCELLYPYYAVSAAEDGVAAWQLLQQESFDLLLSDVMMPKVDGLSLLARLRSQPALAALPVILITARGGSEARSSGLMSGADDYVCKPFAPEELLARVAAALRTSRLRQQLQQAAFHSGAQMQAASLLHDLGNALNSVTLRSDLVHAAIAQLRIDGVVRLAALLQQQNDLVAFFRDDPRGQQVPAFVSQLALQLAQEQQELADKLQRVRDGVGFACGIVEQQRQALAQPQHEMRERFPLHGLLEQALTLSTLGEDVCVRRNYQQVGCVYTDRGQLLQVLVNLLNNAASALFGVAQPQLTLALQQQGGEVRLQISDNGRGIASAQLRTLFDQPCETNPRHGIGLHSCAGWVEQLGGRLQAFSEGPGLGACFELRLPLSVDDGATVQGVGNEHDGSNGEYTDPHGAHLGSGR